MAAFWTLALLHSAACYIKVILTKGYVTRKAHAYTKSIRTINVTCITTRLGRDFSLLIFLSLAHKNVHNCKTAHANTFKLAARIVQRSATCSLSNLSSRQFLILCFNDDLDMGEVLGHATVLFACWFRSEVSVRSVCLELSTLVVAV